MLWYVLELSIGTIVYRQGNKLKEKCVCELCQGDSWAELGERVYDRSSFPCEVPDIEPRLKVLWDKWFPQEQKVVLRYMMCKDCGFILSFPRPEALDVQNTYSYLSELGDCFSPESPDSPIERSRSIQLFNTIKKHIGISSSDTVLDYGGGDGRLMREFVDNGCGCSLVDYNNTLIDGVEKVADTIFDLDDQCKFDLIICNHVIEHVAEPLKIVKELVKHIAPSGHIYIEVPMELWKKIPGEYEPVIHINYFTVNSMFNLMTLAGLSLKLCDIRTTISTHAIKYHAVRAIGTLPDKANPVADKLKAPDAHKWLTPGLLSYWKYYRWCPDEVYKCLLRKILKK